MWSSPCSSPVTDADLLDRDERLRVDVHDVIDDGSRIKGDLGLDLDGGHRRGDSSVGHHRVSPLQTEGFMDGDRSEEPSPSRQDDRDVDLGDRLTDRVRGEQSVTFSQAANLARLGYGRPVTDSYAAARLVVLTFAGVLRRGAEEVSRARRRCRFTVDSEQPRRSAMKLSG